MLKQIARGYQRPAGSKHIIYKHNLLACKVNAIGRDFQRCRGVFSGVFLRHHRRWQLALLADSQNTQAHLIGNGRAEQESTGIKTTNQVRAKVFACLDKVVDHSAQRVGVSQHRREILKQDPFFRKIGHTSDLVRKRLFS